MVTKLNLTACFICLSVSLAPTQAGAASINTFDTQTFAGPAAAGAFNFTVAPGDNRMLVVGYQHERSAVPAREIQSLTWGGIPLNLAIREVNPTSQEIAEIWYLADPPVGTSSISATLNGATENTRGFRLTAVDLFNAAQTGPETAAGSGAGSPSSASISTPITTLSDNALLLGFTHNQGTASYTPGPGVTELFDISAVSIGAAFGSKVEPTAGLTSFDWTQSAANQFNVQAVVSIAAASASAVPEPSAFAIALVAMVGLAGLSWRRRRRCTDQHVLAATRACR